MIRLRIKSDCTLIIDDIAYDVLDPTASSELRIRDAGNGDVRQVSEEDFLALFLAGRLSVSVPV